MAVQGYIAQKRLLHILCADKSMGIQYGTDMTRPCWPMSEPMYSIFEAPQLAGAQRWYALARYIADKILAFVPKTPIPAGVATGKLRKIGLYHLQTTLQ